MQSVYKNAGINPKETGYVEAHGTGTKVGDPIEAAALARVFHEDRSTRNPLFIGSVKSNIGHLEAASGQSISRFLINNQTSTHCVAFRDRIGH